MDLRATLALIFGVVLPILFVVYIGSSYRAGAEPEDPVPKCLGPRVRGNSGW
jgi:hypothetical protein